jgi:hypothetical protein
MLSITHTTRETAHFMHEIDIFHQRIFFKTSHPCLKGGEKWLVVPRALGTQNRQPEIAEGSRRVAAQGCLPKALWARKKQLAPQSALASLFGDG